MKSCLSILLALIILAVFLGAAGLLWYASSSTKAETHPDAEEVGH